MWLDFPDGSVVKNLPPNAGTAGKGNALQYFFFFFFQFRTPVFLSEKSHIQRSLIGYNPEGFKELDKTERLSTHTTVDITEFH